MLEIGRPQEARRAYEASLENVRNRFNSVYGAARACQLAEDHECAARYYRKLLALGATDSPRSELSEARKFVQAPAVGAPRPETECG